jgi:sarcosine oxidase
VGRKDEFDYIVVGLGGIGSAAAYWLARRVAGHVAPTTAVEGDSGRMQYTPTDVGDGSIVAGGDGGTQDVPTDVGDGGIVADERGRTRTEPLSLRQGTSVLGLEQFEIGHDQGASGDHSRITRLSYHTPTYVALAHHALAHWRELEKDAGRPLLVLTGDLLLGPRVSPVPVADYMESLTAADVPFEYLDADEIMYRWPQWRLDSDVHGSFQAKGGIVPARQATLLHAERARAHGAILLENTAVTGIKPLADGVEVTTAETTYRCRRLILTVDAWTNWLLAPLGVELPLTITQEQVTYFASAHPEEFAPDRFPVWIWCDEPNFYGFPVFGEERAVKASEDMAGPEIALESRSFEPDPAMTDRVAEFLRARLPAAHGPVLYSKTCIYTLTPDRDFVIDALPEYPQVLLALGAGHGFKFAGVIGRILSDLVIDGRTDIDIGAFAISRDVLHMAEPPKRFRLRREQSFRP